MPKKSQKTKKSNPKQKPKQPFRFNVLDWICIIVGIIISVITIFTDQNHSLAYIIVSIFMLNCGVLETILGVRGRRSNYIFAIICALASINIAWIEQFYGNMVTNLFYIPISIIGFYSWSKHSDKNKNVIARKFTIRQIIVALAIFVVSTIGLNIILQYFGGNSTILDSTTTIMIVYASLLGVFRYREQWLAWLIADAIGLAMWLGTQNPAVIATRAFFMLSSVYGFINWRKLIKKPGK